MHILFILLLALMQISVLYLLGSENSERNLNIVNV